APHGGHPDELRRLTRLATFNVLHGRALAEGRVSNQKLAEACAALDADVLCLQEIDRNQARSGSVDQIALVAAATGAAAWRVALVAELTDPDLLVATTPLSFVPGYNLVQMRRLARRLAALAGGRPIVLLGDLNVPGPLASWTSGWRPLAAAKTFPAEKPAFQVDHVLGHGPVPAVKAVDAPRLP